MAATQLMYSQLLEKYMGQGMTFAEATKKATKEADVGATKAAKQVMDGKQEKSKMATGKYSSMELESDPLAKKAVYQRQKREGTRR